MIIHGAIRLIFGRGVFETLKGRFDVTVVILLQNGGDLPMNEISVGLF